MRIMFATPQHNMQRMFGSDAIVPVKEGQVMGLPVDQHLLQIPMIVADRVEINALCI